VPDNTTRPDLEPAAQRVAALLPGVRDDALDARTPCDDYTVGGLLVHFMGLTVAFRDAGTKTLGETTGGAPVPGQEKLDPDWRTELPRRLAAMAEAWRRPDAWDGVTEVGGVTLPAPSIGMFGLNELVIHGWDLARATGQPYDGDQATLEAVLGLLSETASPEGTPGLFGPIVEVDVNAPLLDRAVGLTGRSPAWQA
jgi:uncharacterized protein (TIGR03086 family)